MTDSGTSHPASSTDSSTSPPSNVRWHMLAMLMACTSFNHFNRNSMSSAGTEHIMKEYGIDEVSMGFVYSAFLVIYTLCMLPGGWLLDMFGPKRAMLVVLFGTAILVPLTGLSGYLQTPLSPTQQVKPVTVEPIPVHEPSKPNDLQPDAPSKIQLLDQKGSLGEGDSAQTQPPAPSKGLLEFISSAGPLLLSLLLIRAMLGACSAPVHPTAARAVSLWLPNNMRGMGNGLVTGAAVMGVVVTPYVFGYMMDKLGWQLAFAVSGGITLVLGLIWVFYVTDHPFEHSGVNAGERRLLENDIPPAITKTSFRESFVGVFELCRSPSMVCLTLSYLAYSYVQFLFFYWQQQYYIVVLHVEKEESRGIPTIVNLAAVVGMLCGGWLADRLQRTLGRRWGRAIPSAVGMTLCGILLYVGTSTQDKFTVTVCFALSMGALGLSEAPYWISAVDLGGRRAGLAGSLLNTIGNVGGFIGPIVAPILAVSLGWQGAWAVASGMAIVGALLWLGVNPTERRYEDVGR